jgi:hypothetical protein
MSDFDKFWEMVKTGLESLAKKMLQQHWEAAFNDGKAFLEARKKELERWTMRLAARELSKNDFEDLVKGQFDLAEMELLKQLGLAKADVDRFVIEVLKLVIDTAFKVFL